MTTSEARKRAEEAAALRVEPKGPYTEWCERQAAERERRREIVRDALASIYSGAGFLEADALLDHLRDLGATVEIR